MAAIYIFYSLLYTIFCAALWLGWRRASVLLASSEPATVPSAPMVSVVVAVRNEAENIDNLLLDLCGQRYDADLLEVVIVDDGSEDGTAERVRNFSHNHRVDIRLLQAPAHGPLAAGSPKKNALHHGISHARGEVIMTTDGDCRMGQGWVAGMVSTITRSDHLMVSGPVQLNGVTTALDHFQMLDFSSLIGTGAAGIALGYPVFCNGANLAFKKHVFTDLQGYSSHLALPSGDDVFLMQQIHQKWPGRVRFAMDRSAIVYTAPAAGFRAFLHQRIRWASKWQAYVQWYSRVLPLFIFCYYAILMATVAMAIFQPGVWGVVLVFLCLKMAPEYFFLREVIRFGGNRLKLQHYIMAVLVYPIYALSIGVMANIAAYEWKGRKHYKGK